MSDKLFIEDVDFVLPWMQWNQYRWSVCTLARWTKRPPMTDATPMGKNSPFVNADTMKSGFRIRLWRIQVACNSAGLRLSHASGSKRSVVGEYPP